MATNYPRYGGAVFVYKKYIPLCISLYTGQIQCMVDNKISDNPSYFSVKI